MGLVLGRYRITDAIARGSFGRVWKVVDVERDEARALKVGLVSGAMVVDEFAQLAKLSHPSLPKVYEVGRTIEPIDDVPAGAPFFVSQWIGGGRADARRWDAAGLWSLCADLASALATIHAAGLVHGDVAPQNVLVVDEDGHARAVLVDLGLASGSGARGTPAYMAPEAFAGHVEPRSDLYGLGATVYALATGGPPFGAASIAQVLTRALAEPRPLVPGLPQPLADLLCRLIAIDADDRPPSASAVLDELDQLAPVLGIGSSTRGGAKPPRRRTRVAAPPVPTSWPGASAWIDALADALAGTSVQVVAGDRASGARELVDAAVRRWQLHRVARGDAGLESSGPSPSGPHSDFASAKSSLAGTLDDVAARLAVDARGERGFVERVARAIRAANRLVVLSLGDDPRTMEAIAALARIGGPAVVAIADAAPTARTGVDVRTVPLLDDAGVAALAARVLGATPPIAWARALRAATGGRAPLAVELLRSIADEREPFAVDVAARATSGIAELRRTRLAGVSEPAAVLTAAVAAWGGRARLDRALATARSIATVGLAEIAELERAGLAQRHGDELAIDRATAQAIEVRDDLGALAIAGLAIATEPDDRASPDALAALLDHAPLDAPHAALACDVAEQLLARGRADRARTTIGRTIAALPARAGLIAARAASASGAYREAIELARAAATAGADGVEAELVVARAAQRAGDLDAAEAALARLVASHPANPDAAGAYARLLVTRSRYADARAVASRIRAPLAGLRAEALGLAAYYLGELDDADRAFAALELGATAAGDAAEPGALGRALSLRGMVAQQRGQLGLASDRYREAARRLAEVGEVHAAAVAELNLGTALSERGRASEALPHLVAAARVFGDLGATTERVAADLNRGNALLALGQATDARDAADAALADASGAPHLHAFALCIAGDARRRLGDVAGAERRYREALALGDAHARLSAAIALAEIGIDPTVDIDPATPDDRDRWTLARARLRHDTAPAGEAAELARAVAAVARRAADSDRLERAFRAHAVAASLASRGRDVALARAEAERARATHALIVAATAPAFRAALAADPDLARLPPIEAAAARPHRDHDAGYMRRLLTLSRRLNSEDDVARILDEVIDTAIEMTAAERGFLLLRRGDELAPVVSRNFAAADLVDASPSLSRSIAERAAQSGEPVVTVDAGIDERFGAAASVAALRLRSVLVVPLRQRGTVIGCIYVDHRLRGGAFDDASAAVLAELADIAALAIYNRQLADDLRATTREVDALAGKLSAELAERDAELVRVKAELPDRDRLRNRYDRIVGRSPAMVRMLDIIDRAAATSLPVVVVGESGTGKELVARALHDHGPRKAGPFVAVNCSAVPEPLLESELFGHVRGAFTGADRDRRGLFEVADGGTLFLDEIADTGAAMQAKLLRVLQDGVIRRVGDNRTRTIDVRVIVASQRSLAELATAGRFREDLRYRLEVITVPVPPLRDRDGDVPLLVTALLAQLCGNRPPPRLTRAAMRALGQHRWPGNVRELENALARGAAMGGDVIDLADLPETIATQSIRPEPARPLVGDDLRLKPALVATEQSYIGAAMTRAKGNQTVAARLLGLSRFGLQKKLRRLAGDGDDDE